MGPMKAAILFESLTGTTRKAGELIAANLQQEGWGITGVSLVRQPDFKSIQDADIVIVGTWVKGLFVAAQSPFGIGAIENMPAMSGKLAATYCTFAVNPGKTLDKLDKDVVAGEVGSGRHAAVGGRVGVATYAAVVEFIAKTLRETAKARRAVQAEREKLGPELKAAKKRLDELRGLTQLEETRVFVTVQGAAPTEGQLVLEYMLPGATWETVHELRAADADPTSVEVTSFAVVTQASGEDWDNAELSFSTQSSTAAVRIPELLPLIHISEPTRPY